MSEDRGLKHFMFFESYQRAIEHMPTENMQLQMYQAITRYMFNGIEPDFQGERNEITLLNIAWDLVLPTLDLSIKRAMAGSMGRGIERPSMRGNQNASKGEENKAKTKQNQNKTKQKQNYKDKEKDKEKEMEGDNTREELALRFAPTPEFSIPSIDEIIAVMQSVCENKKVTATHEQLNDAAERFFDTYDPRNWTTAKGIKLRSWEGEARKWVREDISKGMFKAEPTTQTTKRVPKEVITIHHD